MLFILNNISEIYVINKNISVFLLFFNLVKILNSQFFVKGKKYKVVNINNHLFLGSSAMLLRFAIFFFLFT